MEMQYLTQLLNHCFDDLREILLIFEWSKIQKPGKKTEDWSYYFVNRLDLDNVDDFMPLQWSTRIKQNHNFI